MVNKSIIKRVANISKANKNNKLIVNEIFLSLQGESTFSGRPCVFIRTTGCHLRCNYCDTKYAFFNGKEMSITDIFLKTLKYKVNLVELTGGEPLLQKASFSLLTKLLNAGLEVLLETSGSINLKRVDKRTKIILDIKTPTSGEETKNYFKNLNQLWSNCEVKFVICNKIDYDFAKKIINNYKILKKNTIIFSPETKQLKPKLLASWIIRDRLDVILQLQLHKIIWSKQKGV